MAFQLGLIGGSVAGQIGSGAVGGITGGMQEQVRQWGNFILPCGLYQPAEAFLPYVMHMVDEHSFSEFRKYNGLALTPWSRHDYQIAKLTLDNKLDIDEEFAYAEGHVNNKVLQLQGKILPPSIVNELYNRDMMTDKMADFQYLGNSGGDRYIANTLGQLRFQIPGPSDLVAFAVRDCFDPAIVTTFQYHKELPVAILPAMKAQGYHGEVGIDIPPGATTTLGAETRTKAQWFDLYWWSHWQLPSVGQGYEMLHRLYPASPHGPSPDVTLTTAFTQDNLNLLLKANDYPPFWREKLTQISFAPLTRVDVRRMHAMEIMNEDQVYHAYRAGGYNDTNAERLMRFTVKMNERALWAPLVAKTKTELEFAYSQGMLTEGEARIALFDLQIEQRIIPSIIDLWDMKIKNKRMKDYLTVIKNSFLLGTMTLGQTTTALGNLGLPLDKRNEYVELWQLIRTGKRKFVSAATNLKYYKHMMITRNALILRLTHLNFDDVEIKAMVAYADAEVDAMRAKEINKQLQQAVKKAERNHEKKLAKLLAPYTEENITKFYEQDGISLEQVYMILNLKGWADTTIQDWIRVHLEREVTIKWMEKIKKIGQAAEEMEITTVY